MNPLKRTLICTSIALVSGALASYFGGQMSWLAYTHQCSDRPEGLLNAFCRARHTPGALWKGSSAGLWTGTILGAFLAGIATRQERESRELLLKERANNSEKTVGYFEGSLQNLERLTPEQMEVLQRFVVVLQSGESPEWRLPEGFGAIAPNSEELSVQQFVQWLTLTTQMQPAAVSLSETQARKMLRQFGFSQTAIAAARVALTEAARETRESRGRDRR